MKWCLQLVFMLSLFFSTMQSAQNLKVLPPEEAFKVSATQSAQGVLVRIDLGEGIYLYDDKLKLEFTAPLALNLDTIVERPKPEFFHDYWTQRQSFEMLIPQSVIDEKVQNSAFSIQLSYQGCSELGLCYQPMQESYTFNAKAASSATLSEQDIIAQSLAGDNIALVLVSFFGFGLLLSLTPCTFPMIPILSSIIVSQSSGSMSAKRGFIAAFVYVLAMSLAYAFAGILAGLFGANLQASLQNPWVISSFSAVFVLLALSMFGFFEIKMPSFIQNKISKKSDQMQTHGLFGIAVMGFLSALVVGPCVAAPLAGALIYIGQSGDALLGGLALFIMSLGMGVPLLIIGTTAGKYMPRPGGWMENVTAVFGVLLLAVAVWMLSRILPSFVTMALWSLLIITASIYAGALEPLKEDKSGWMKLFKSAMVILFLYGAALFIGFISGATDPLNPFDKFTSKTIGEARKSSLNFTYVANVKAIEQAVKESKAPVMLDFYADWCVNCIEFEKFTFSDARVKEKMQKLTLLKADVTKNSADDKMMQKEFGIFGPPAILFFKNGKEVEELRLVGYKNADEFLAHLERVGL
jgi:thiol:disulfide interchange protein DsbD